MVFCNTRRNVDFIADNLMRNGIHAKAIHGKIEQKKRMRVLEEFHKKGLGVLVCTDVAARGLDIKGVSHVYNYDVPPEPKDYIHRIGRTARAGKEGKAIIILASRDYEKFGDLMRLEGIKITPEKLPEIEIVRIKIDSGRGNNRFNRGHKGKDFSRGPRGGGNRARGRSYGYRPRERRGGDGPRSLNKASYNKRPNFRRPSNKRRNNLRGSSKYRR